MVKLTEKLLCLLLSAAIFCGIAVAVPRSASKAEEVSSSGSAEEIAEMSKYDGRDYGIVTPVKDQGTTNLCWAYSSVAAAETSILKSGIDPTANAENLYLNPTAVAYRVFRRDSDPLGNTGGELKSGDFSQATGNPLYAAKLFSMWWAPVSGSQPSLDPYENPSYRFENAYYIPENKSDPDAYIAAVKDAVAKYGAVTFQYNNMRETEYYNPKSESGSGSSPHACVIIGWDDTIPASRFQPGSATRDGGWLVKNSYNSLEYFWLSYDNTSSSVYAFTFAPKEKYDFNYYYDGNLDDFPLRNDKTVANVFCAQKGGEDGKSEYIKAVNAGVSGENVTVEVEIYKNLNDPFGGQSDIPTSGGVSAAKKTVFSSHGGYLTVELDTPVKVEKGEWFSVIVRVSNAENNAKVITAYKDVKTLSYSNGGYGWSKLGNFVGRIKAYTTLEDDSPTLPEFKVSSAFLSLGKSISLNFRVKKDVCDAYENIYAVVECDGDIRRMKGTSDESGRLRFLYDNLTPAMAKVPVVFTLYGTANGQAYSHTVEYSVYQYCVNMFNKTEDVALKRLLTDLLNYAASAQVYTNYRTDDLANAGFDQTYATKTFEEPVSQFDKAYVKTDSPSVVWKSVALRLTDSVSVRFQFSASDLSGLSVRFSIGDYKYETSEFFAVDGKTDRYYVLFEDILPKEMREAFTVTAYRNGVPVSNTVKYSIQTYAEGNTESGTPLSEILVAMLKYGDSCKAYFG